MTNINLDTKVTSSSAESGFKSNNSNRLNDSDKFINSAFSNPNYKKKPHIAIIDDVLLNKVYIDYDRTPDIEHGKVVERFIKEGIPDSNVDWFYVFEPSLVKDIDENLKKILLRMHDGEQFDAINMSLSCDTSYQWLSEKMGISITPQNLAQKSTEIKTWLSDLKNLDSMDSESRKNIYNGMKTISKLNKLSSNGVKIYTAAGNSKDTFNLYSLADNINVVGAVDENGKDIGCFSNNSLVTRKEKGIFKIQRVTDNESKGFDFTEDGSVDILDDETTALIKSPKQFICGTSFSTPLALVEDFKAKK